MRSRSSRALDLNAPGPRLAAGVIVGGIAAGVLVFFFRDCLGGPYAAVDPWLVDNWLSRIVEARPVWESFAALPAYTVAIAVPPIVGLAVHRVAAAARPAPTGGSSG